tara:strand:+ start:5445 stop:7526 length:2082 start_codon:yes stop_codon:yes gene_type:complete
MIYKSIQNNKFNILLFGAILIFIKNKKTKIYFFTHNPIRILFSFIPILSNIARIYPRYFEVTEDAIIISYLNKSLVYFKDYEIPKVLNYRFLSPAINYKKKEIIFGDYINLGFFLKRPKTQNIHIRKFDGKTLKSIISIRNIKHIHNIEYVNDKEIIYSTGDSVKESKIAKLNIVDLNTVNLLNERCAWIIKLNQNIYLAGTDYPSKENYIFKCKLEKNKLIIIEKNRIPNSTIYFQKKREDKNTLVYFSTSIENFRFFDNFQKVFLYKYDNLNSTLNLLKTYKSFLPNYLFGFSSILIQNINNKIVTKKLNCIDTNLIYENFSNLKKVLRYFTLYGLGRTYIKVLSRIHINNIETFDDDLFVNTKAKLDKQYVAIIGSGNFAFSNIAYFISKKENDSIRYFFDIDKSKALSASKKFRSKFATNNINYILNDKKVKIAFIATNHSTHEFYASLFLKKNIHVHIEKPHVTDTSQLHNIIKNKKNSKIYLGFNRPKSNIFRFIIDLLKNQKGPISLNWFILGHQIDQSHWYFFKEEGGRILGNFTHWIDLTFHIIGKDSFPCKIKCTDSKNSPSDFTFIFQFANGSQATLMFSAKGEVFDGVRESLILQKSNLFLKLDDFKNLYYQIGSKYINKSLIYRDHGHKNNILNSLDGVKNNKNLGESEEYIYNSAYFFLKVKEAYEKNKDVIVSKDELM